MTPSAIHARRSRLALAGPLALVTALVVAPRVAAAQPATGATVRGTVRGANAQPLAQAEVIVGDSLRARTDSTGAFTFAGLAPGPIELTVRRVGYAPLAVPLTLAAGQRRTLAIELAPLPYALDPVIVSASRPGLFGQVVDDAGQPIAGADVFVFGADSTATRGDGGFGLPGLGGRTYLVLVRRTGHVAAEFTVTLPRDRGQEVRVELARLGDDLTGSARRIASGYSMMDMRRRRELDHRMRVNLPYMVSREQLQGGGKLEISMVLDRNLLSAPAHAARSARIPDQNHAAMGGEAATAAAEASRVEATIAQNGRAPARGACWFIDGDWPLDPGMASSYPAAWLESVEISRRDETGTLRRRLPAGMDPNLCQVWIVLWTKR